MQMCCDSLHAWMSTQSRLTTLLSSLIACQWVGFRLYEANYLVGWNWTLVCFSAHRGPTSGLILLHCFSGVADTQGISVFLNALELSRDFLPTLGSSKTSLSPKPPPPHP